MTALGCPRGYGVELRTRGGRHRVRMLDGITSLTWGRVLNGTSDCTVDIVPRSRSCAAVLDKAMGWAYEVAVWRDTDLVWEGPLLDKDDNGTSVTLLASDVSAWLPRRIVHKGYNTMKKARDVAHIAADMLADAYRPDDPNVIKHLWKVNAGVRAARKVEPESVMADADLAELVKLGLDWTTVGRAIALFGSGKPLGRVAALSGKHFTGNLSIREAASDVVTRSVIQGGGVRGVAGGKHKVFGLLERLDTQSNVSTQRDANAAARAALYTPSLMLASGSLTLTQRAPVSLDELIPGVATVVSGKGAACEVTAEVTMIKLDVEWSPSGEKVSATFVETGDRAVGDED